MQATDFANSYMSWSIAYNPTDTRRPGHKPWGNSARILLDARCVLSDEGSGQSDEFFLIAPCRTEWMYQEENLFQIPNREYRGIWSRTQYLDMGKGITYDGQQQNWKPVKDHFTSLSFTVQPLPHARALRTDEEIIEATMDNLPIVAQTEIWDSERRLRAMIEYPVKTMNFHAERRRFQVDTGPVLLPDFTSTAEHWIEWFSMAHVVYNTLDRAEFVIRRPTPITKDGREVCSVLYYSETRVHEAKHTIQCGRRSEN